MNKILPKYSYIDPSNNEISDIFQIAEDYKEEVSFESFFKDVKDKFVNIPTPELVKIFLSKNEIIPDNDIYIFAVQNEIDDILGKDILDVERFLQDEKKYFLKQVEEDTKRYFEMEEKKKKFVITVNNLEPYPSSNIEITKITLQIKTNLSGLNIYQIFDDIKTNEYFPFIKLNEYYKLFDNFYPKDNLPELADKIIIGIPNDKGEIKDKFCLIYYPQQSSLDQNLIIEIEADLRSISRDDLIKRILSIFQTLNPEKEEINESNINSIFFISGIRFDKSVLADLIMNNDDLSNFLSIDESSKTQKQKSEVNIYYNDTTSGNPAAELISASLISKKISQKDLEIRDKNREIFPYGGDMVRVNVRKGAKGMESIERFKTMISKLLRLYPREEEGVLKFYRQFIPNFGLEEKKDEIEVFGTSLKYQVPDLFITGYVRKCSNVPSIIPDEEVDDYESKGFRVMPYPKEEKEKSDQISNNYICDHPEHKYPTLMINTLENKNKYPYLPCCGKKDPDVPNSNYREYFYNEIPIETKQQRVLHTNKIAEKQKFAEIPNKLDKLFKSFDDLTFYREGIYRSKNSFIECVLRGAELDEDIDDTNFDKFLNKIRLGYIKAKDSLNLCKQECYDFDPKEYLQNLDNYFDPSLFIRFMEEKYEINIYLFKRDEDSVRLVLPRHTNGYFFYPKKFDKTILIYEHLGTERDKAEYPQCELICFDQEGTAEYIFETSSEFIQKVNDLYLYIASQYHILNIINTPISLPFKSEDIESQYIDNFGKTRGVKINGIYILTEPLPPFGVKIEPLENFQNSASQKDKILKIISKSGLTLFSDEGERLIAHRKNGGVMARSYTFLISLSKKESIFKEFEKNRKIAKLLKENFIYLYSKFLSENNLEPENSSIIKFSKDIVKLDSKTDYDLSITKFIKGKLVLKDEETLKRLIYYTKLISSRNKDLIINYHKTKYIQSYYSDISDFRQYPLQNIIKGTTNLIQYIKMVKLDTVINRQIKFIKNPYFLNLEDSLFIAQPVENMEKAVEISNVWNEDRYNPIQSTPDISSATGNSFANNQVYVFNNVNDIIKIGEGENKVLVYQKDGIKKWVALLEL